MGKAFRFLLQYAWANLGAAIAFGAIVLAGCYITGVPGSAEVGGLFVTYYAMFPTMLLLCLFLYAFALCTNNLNLALAMGVRRRDFFWALQGIMVFYAAVCWVLQLFMSMFPAVANWASGRWDLFYAYDGSVWLFPLLSVILMILGCLSGLMTAKHKVLGMVVVTFSVLVLTGTTAVLILASETTLLENLRQARWTWLWTTLPQVLAGVLALSAVGGEVLIWRTIQRFTVR